MIVVVDVVVVVDSHTHTRGKGTGFGIGGSRTLACQPRCCLVSITPLQPPQILQLRSISITMLATTNYSFNYDTHTYLAILLTQSSSLLVDPAKVHPNLKHLGPVSYDILPYLIRSRNAEGCGTA